jgi:hypothetical protein
MLSIVFGVALFAALALGWLVVRRLSRPRADEPDDGDA